MSEKTITIQKTAKSIKAVIALSLLLIIIGFVAMRHQERGIQTIGFIIAICGVLLNISAKISKWWNHS